MELGWVTANENLLKISFLKNLPTNDPHGKMKHSEGSKSSSLLTRLGSFGSGLSFPSNQKISQMIDLLKQALVTCHITHDPFREHLAAFRFGTCHSEYCGMEEQQYEKILKTYLKSSPIVKLSSEELLQKLGYLEEDNVCDLQIVSVLQKSEDNKSMLMEHYDQWYLLFKRQLITKLLSILDEWLNGAGIL